ncbi:tol-pal system protein YbgF [Pseudomonas sp. NW5]|uniref:tol-pal system protein YbgF n=1 Tax=Pseudomonas sp. NW5 TaxID=2934934 RepID=UPI002020AAFC|nr:tol-pal system protein YbgF [Pseudomonas sp. NW5]MCL7461587.1 tol-pal system protein YbgF [Pseudomonas sp. NW5]
MLRFPRHFILSALLVSPLTLQAQQVPVTDVQGGYYPPAGQGMAGGAYVGGAAAPVTAQGELFMQLQQLQEETARLRGMLEEQQYEIQRLKQEGLERYQDLDSRLSAGAAAPAPLDPAAPAPAATEAGTATAPVVAAPGDPAKEKLFYDAAFDLIKAKDFAKADQAFTAFLGRYPNSQYSANAQYWLGEVKLARGDLAAAGQAFARVAQAWPQHQKVADAMYKLGDVERRLGNRDKARAAFQQVVTRYPGSSAAQLAQRELTRL